MIIFKLEDLLFEENLSLESSKVMVIAEPEVMYFLSLVNICIIMYISTFHDHRTYPHILSKLILYSIYITLVCPFTSVVICHPGPLISFLPLLLFSEAHKVS